jgi:hypothetical protein
MTSKNISLLSFTVVCLLSLQGCIKKDPESNIAQVLFVPLAPNTVPASAARPLITTNFNFNNTIFATQIGYSNSTTTGTLRYALPYYTVEPKAASVISYDVPTNTSSWGKITKDLVDGQVYSSFLIDTVPNTKAVLVTDDLDDPTPGKVKIRFFNFCPNSPALDVVLQGTTTKVFSSRTFNDQATTTTHQNFIEVDAGNYTFLFNNAATGATVFTMAVQTFLPERIYTIAARGLIGNTTTPVGALVYANKP